MLLDEGEIMMKQLLKVMQKLHTHYSGNNLIACVIFLCHIFTSINHTFWMFSNLYSFCVLLYVTDKDRGVSLKKSSKYPEQFEDFKSDSVGVRSTVEDLGTRMSVVVASNPTQTELA